MVFRKLLLSTDELKKLKTFKRPYCVSAYVPLAAADTPDANRIAVKNILRRAENTLAEAGAEPKGIRKTLAPMYSLIERHEFWAARQESLAFFAHPKLFRYYHLPLARTPHLLTVKQGFTLGPLLDVRMDDAPYYLLALSHNQVQLFKGSHYQLHAIHPKNLPVNMQEALRIDEYPNWRETHIIAPVNSGKGSEAFHGQYNVAQTDKRMLVEFFHLINKRLRKLLSGSNKPLIIGGVNYLLPLYRQVNTYPYLLPGVIKGNLEHVSLDELRERAWEVTRRVRHEHAIH